MTSPLIGAPKEIVVALTPAIILTAVNAAKLAAQATLEFGAYPEKLDFFDLMAIGAWARLGVFGLYAFLRLRATDTRVFTGCRCVL